MPLPVKVVKQIGVRLLVVTIWSFACHTAPVVTNTSVILSSNKIQNGDVLVLANPDPSGKWPLKRRERITSVINTKRQRYRDKEAQMAATMVL